jgi:hypothetical protein
MTTPCETRPIQQKRITYAKLGLNIFLHTKPLATIITTSIDREKVNDKD